MQKIRTRTSAPFFDPDLFTGPGMNADAIVTQLRQSASWAQLSTSHDEAVANAKAGKFVIAGMTSSELHSSNGHIAVVVGDDGQMSGTVKVPICYAGSLNAAARVQRTRVSRTFGTQPARQSKISYFAREVQTMPAIVALSRLVDGMRGVNVPTAELPLVAAARTAVQIGSKAKAKVVAKPKSKSTKVRRKASGK